MTGVIYARYSSDNQREESIEGQIRECLDFAERQKINIVGNYIDRAFSAKTDHRPDFQRMIADSFNHSFDVIIVWKLDRFARNRYDSARYKALLKKNGVRVISAKENISDRPDGILLESILEGYAEYYSADLSEKTLRGMTENALKCKFNGNYRTYGYVIDKDGHFQIEPAEAAIVYEMYNSYLNGMTCAELATELNRRGLKNNVGHAFGTSTVVNMLKNRKYIGEYRYMNIVTPHGIPEIVPEEMFDKVQRRLKSKHKHHTMHNPEPVDFLLSGKLICGKCGTPMHGDSGISRSGVKYCYYSCWHARKKLGCDKKSVRQEWIENLVIDWTMENVLKEDVIHDIAAAVVKQQNKGNSTLSLLLKRMEETKKSIDNIYKAIEEGFVGGHVNERLAALEEEEQGIQKKILEEEKSHHILTEEQVVFWINQFKDGDVHDEEFLKFLIQQFIKEVYLYDDKVVINYNIKETHGDDMFNKELISSGIEGNVRAQDNAGEPVIPEVVHQNRLGFFLATDIFRLTVQGAVMLHCYQRTYYSYSDQASKKL